MQINNYVLSSNLKHTFQSQSSIQFVVEVNAGSSAETRVWFDSPLYPSKVVLPSTDYARPVVISTYSFDGSRTDMFDHEDPEGSRLVTVRVNVTDPFGGYDVKTVQAFILYNGSQTVTGPIEMTRVSDVGYRGAYSQSYTANWSYPLTAQLGNYTAKVQVVDNNGYYHKLDTGSFEPYVEYGTHKFQIGPITYYNPSIRFVDDVGDPLPDAQVFVTWPNGARDELPRYTLGNGVLSLTRVIPSSYGFMVLWKNSVVSQTSLKIDSDGPYTIKTEVYELTVSTLDNGGKPLAGAYILAYKGDLGYGFAVSNESGRVAFKLPNGVYDIQAHYGTVYWLSQVKVIAEKTQVAVTASSSMELTFSDYPPPIWGTTGFILLVAGVVVAIIVIYLMKNLQGNP